MLSRLRVERETFGITMRMMHRNGGQPTMERMARPRKGEEKHAHKHIGVRVSDELRAEIEESAAAGGRTLADEVRELIIAGLEKKRAGSAVRRQKSAKRAKHVN